MQWGYIQIPEYNQKWVKDIYNNAKRRKSPLMEKMQCGEAGAPGGESAR